MVTISKDIQISVIVQNYEGEDMGELLESLKDQTHDNLEIICLADNPSSIKTDSDLIIMNVGDFKMDDINGEYAVFANPSDRYYLIGFETLLDYFLLNDLELLLFSHINYDIITAEIYERNRDAFKEISKDIKSAVFSCDDFSKHLFFLNPGINGIFYKKSFLTNHFSNESLINDKYLFFKSILNSQRIGIFENPVYIKKDQSRYKLKGSKLLNEHYYGVENCSLEDIDGLNDNILELFKELGKYESHKKDLANFKMDLYKEFLSNNSSKKDFEHVRDDLNSNYDVSDFNEHNALFYNSIIKSNSFNEALTNLKANNFQDDTNEGESSSNSSKLFGSVRKLKNIFKK